MQRQDKSKIVKSQSIRDVLNLTTFGTWVVLDLDNTVIESLFELGSDQWISKLIAYACEKKSENTPSAVEQVIELYTAVQHHLRMKAVEPEVAKLIRALQDIGIPVIGLTARGKSLIDTTHRQLEEIDIDFSRNQQGHSPTILLGNQPENTCTFQGGIIFCDGKDKGLCFTAFTKQCSNLPTHILMVDDKEKHVSHVGTAATKLGIEFNGIHYGYLDEKVKNLDMKKADSQLLHIKNKLPKPLQDAIDQLKMGSEDILFATEDYTDIFAPDPLKKSSKRKHADIIQLEASRLERSYSASSFFSPKRNANPEKEHKQEPEEDKQQAPFINRTNTSRAISVYGVQSTLFQGQSYEMLTHKKSITPNDKLSCRGIARENILVNFQSPELKTYSDAYLAACKKLADPDADTQPIDECWSIENDVLPNPCQLYVLQDLVSYVRTQFNSATEAEIKHIIQQEQAKLSSIDDPTVAPLEWFANAKHVSCRHQALMTAYMLAVLIDSHAKENESTFASTGSRIYRFRTQLQVLADPSKWASHAVVIYEAANGHRYLLDASRQGKHNKGLVADLTDLSVAKKEKINAMYLPYDGNKFIQKIMEVYDEVANLAQPSHVKEAKKENEHARSSVLPTLG